MELTNEQLKELQLQTAKSILKQIKAQDVTVYCKAKQIQTGSNLEATIQYNGLVQNHANGTSTEFVIVNTYSIYPNDKILIRNGGRYFCHYFLENHNTHLIKKMERLNLLYNTTSTRRFFKRLNSLVSNKKLYKHFNTLQKQYSSCA